MCPVNIDMFIDCGSLILMLSIFILYIGLVPSFGYFFRFNLYSTF